MKFTFSLLFLFRPLLPPLLDRSWSCGEGGSKGSTGASVRTQDQCAVEGRCGLSAREGGRGRRATRFSSALGSDSPPHQPAAEDRCRASAGGQSRAGGQRESGDGHGLGKQGRTVDRRQHQGQRSQVG